jgi:hypothetical protein
MQGSVEMDAGFLVNGNPIGAGFGERRYEFVGSFNHEMTIERDTANLSERGNDGRTDCEIGDEVAVHDVDVQNGRPALDGRLRFCAEAGKVSRENGGSELNHRKA